jgi:uncharacterized RDD family membrane protein YckC/Tfp pilus assembly major pilin PilA
MALGTTTVIPLYAGFWRRAAAIILDSIILLVPNVIVSYVLSDSTLVAFLATIIVTCAYYAGFHASASQATPGKMAFGIKVTGLQGERISLARAIGRYFATWISSLLLCIGWLLAGLTAKKQALHDMIAATLVVNGKAEPAEVAAGGAPMPITAGVWVLIALILVFPFFGGMVAAIAIPAYQDYTVRARVNQAVASTSTLRDEIAQFLEKKQPVAPRNVDVSSPYLQSIEVTDRGEISTRFVSHVAGGGRLVWTPVVDASGSVTWKCASADIAPRYLPARCRG